MAKTSSSTSYASPQANTTLGGDSLLDLDYLSTSYDFEEQDERDREAHLRSQGVRTTMKFNYNPKAYTEEEMEAIRHGVRTFGVGNWKLIKQANPTVLHKRTVVNIKDKHRTMVKRGEIPAELGKHIAPTRKQRQVFTTREKFAIVLGVRKLGEGRWADIRLDFLDVLHSQDGESIKDCYRNMTKSGVKSKMESWIQAKSAQISPDGSETVVVID